MAEEPRIFFRSAVFGFVVVALYWWASQEVAGTILLGAFGLTGVLLATCSLPRLASRTAESPTGVPAGCWDWRRSKTRPARRARGDPLPQPGPGPAARRTRPVPGLAQSRLGPSLHHRRAAAADPRRDLLVPCRRARSIPAGARHRSPLPALTGLRSTLLRALRPGADTPAAAVALSSEPTDREQTTRVRTPDSPPARRR